MLHEYQIDLSERPYRYLQSQFTRASLPPLAISIPTVAGCIAGLHWDLGAFFPAILGIMGGAWIVYFGVWIWRFRLAARRFATMDSRIFRYRLDDEGYHFDNPIGRGSLKWGFKGKVVCTRNSTYILSVEVGNLPLPDNASPELLNAVRAQLK